MKPTTDAITICKAYTKRTRRCEITPLEHQLTYCCGVDCTYGHDVAKITKWLELRLSHDTKDRWQARELYFDMVTNAVEEDKCVPFPPYTPKPREKHPKIPLANVPIEYFESEMEIIKKIFKDDMVLANRHQILYTLAFLEQFRRKKE